MPNDNETDQPMTNPPTPGGEVPVQPENDAPLPQFPLNELVKGDFGVVREPFPEIRRRDNENS